MRSVTLVLTHLAALAVGWFLGTVFHGCGRSATPGALAIGAKSVTEATIRTDTVHRDSIIFRDRWRTRTVSVVEYDTLASPVESLPYTRRTQTTTDRDDTIDVAFHHPEGLFDIDFRPGPDTVRTVTIDNTSLIEVRDSRKWGVGLHCGLGAQWGADGVIRAGPHIGIGVNFNLWEP